MSTRINLLSEFNLKHQINKPTRISQSASCIYTCKPAVGIDHIGDKIFISESHLSLLAHLTNDFKEEIYWDFKVSYSIICVSTCKDYWIFLFSLIILYRWFTISWK